MARVATGVKAKIGAYWEAAAAGTPDVGVLLLISAGLEDEDNLADRDTVADILATTNDEATFTGYARKTVAPAVTRDDAADTQTLTLAGSPPLTVEWTAAGGAGGGGTNNILGRMVYYYDPTPGSSTDAQKIHLASTPVNAATDGSTLRITIPSSGIATYRDGSAAQSAVAAAGGSGLSAGSVYDVHVNAAAALSADKLADGTVRKVLTASERSKLTGIATGATAYTDELAVDAAAGALVAGTHTGISFAYDDPAGSIAATVSGGTTTPADGSVTNAKVATNAAINADKLADGTTNKILTATERTKLAGIATGATAYTTENAQDDAAALLTGGTHSGISFAYVDASNRLDATVTASGSGVGGVSLIVAASDAKQAAKDVADYVCDGVNDHIEINAAITAAASAPQGGEVLLSAGIFYQGSSPIRMQSRVTLRGLGRATRIRATTAITPGATQASYLYGWGGQIESYNEQTHRTSILDLELDGTYKQCHGIYYRTTGISDADGTDAWNQTGAEGFDAVHHIRNVYAHEQLGNCFHLNGHGGVFVSNCRAWGNGNSTNRASGWYISIIDSFFVNCESGASLGHAWEIIDANNHFTNCKGWFGYKNGFYIGVDGVRNTFVGCVAQDNREHGWYIAVGPIALAACGADSNSYDMSPSTAITGATFNGFQIDAASQATLAACWSFDKNENSRGRRQQYGYGIVNTATRCMIHGTGHNNAVGPLTGGSRTGNDNSIFIVANGVSVAYPMNAGRVYSPVLSTAPTDADIPVNGMCTWLDNTTNTLTFRIRKSDGTYITKTL